jgi:hypothetical protein
VKVSLAGKLLVRMVTDWFWTTDLIENVGKPLYPGMGVGGGVVDEGGLFQNQLYAKKSLVGLSKRMAICSDPARVDGIV